MSAGFQRRFLFDPGNNVLTNIESINILDLTPPGDIAGVGTGMVMIVGEFEDGPYATPQQVASASDLQASFGSLGFQYGNQPGNNPCAVQRFADGTLAAESWNGNGIVQLNAKQFAALVICRVDTSVGTTTLTPNAFLTGAAAFTYVLQAGQILGLDIGAGPQTATFSATASTLTSTAGTYASINPGDTVTLGYDQQSNFTVTFLPGDTTQALVLARINQYAGFTFAATVTGTTFSLTGTAKGSQAQVRVVSSSSGGVLTNLGLTVGTTFGTGNVANIAAVKESEIASIVQTAISGTRVETDQNGNLRISNSSGLAQSYIAITSATTATALGFVVGSIAGNMGIAVMLSTTGTYPGTNTGTFQLSIDGGPVFTVTVTASMTQAQLITAINTAAGKTIAVADSTLNVAIFGTNPGGTVNLVSASANNVVTQFGLTVGQVTGLAFPLGSIPAGTVIQDATAAHVFVTAQSVKFTPTGVSIGGVIVATAGPWIVKIRHALDNGTGTAATAGTLTSIPTPPQILSLTSSNLQTTTAALTESAIDAQYVNALAATLDLNTIAQQVNITYSARQSNTVRRALKANALSASANGCFGRITCLRTPLGTTKQLAQSTVQEPGVGAYSDQRVIYCYPQARTFVPIIAQRGTSGGLGFTFDGNIDVGADGFLASIMSQLPPEENPGQETTFTDGVVGIESSPNAQGFMINDYIAFKAIGICAMRMDGGTAIFQSGCTSVNPAVYPSLVRISRRRMADFIQDSISDLASGFSKKLNSRAQRKALISEVRGFLEQLLNINNPDFARIGGFTFKDQNTPTTLALGIDRMLLNVMTLTSMDSIVFQTTVGESVVVEEQLPQAA